MGTKLTSISLLKGKVLFSTKQVSLVLRNYLDLFGLLAELLNKPLLSLFTDIMPVLGQHILALKSL